MKNILTILLLLTGRLCCGQNFIANSDFEHNGQPECNNWYDNCWNELTYLCAGIVDTGSCNDSVFGAQLYADAPSAGGQWCMSLRTPADPLHPQIRTNITGQFWGVYEFKVWTRADTGAGLGIYIEPKLGMNYTGWSASGTNSSTWTLLVHRDTIHELSDNVDIRFAVYAGGWPWGNTVYFDLADFRMVESWTDIKSTKQHDEISLFPNPFSDQLSFSLAHSEQATIILYNFLGQQILQQTFTNFTTINTGQMQDGIYFYELRSNKGTLKTGKVVKQ